MGGPYQYQTRAGHIQPRLAEAEASSGSWSEDADGVLSVDIDGTVTGDITSPSAWIAWRLRTEEYEEFLVPSNFHALIDNITTNAEGSTIMVGLGSGSTDMLAGGGYLEGASSAFRVIVAEQYGTPSTSDAAASGSDRVIVDTDLQARTGPSSRYLNALAGGYQSDGTQNGLAASAIYGPNMTDVYVVLAVWNNSGSGSGSDTIGARVRYKSQPWMGF